MLWCSVPHHADNLGTITRHPANFGAITRHAKTLCHSQVKKRFHIQQLLNKVSKVPLIAFFCICALDLIILSIMSTELEHDIGKWCEHLISNTLVLLQNWVDFFPFLIKICPLFCFSFKMLITDLKLRGWTLFKWYWIFYTTYQSPNSEKYPQIYSHRFSSWHIMFCF